MKPRDKTKVTIEEVAPDPDQFEQLIKDPIKLRAAFRQSIKHAERRLKLKQNRRRGVEKALNEKAAKKKRRKSIAIGIANQLRQKEPRLRLSRTTDQLAERIRTLWPKEESPPSRRTIHRWLVEK